MKSRILEMLGTGLDPRLTYHSRKHTEDVLQQAERIALSENLRDHRSILLIKIAALFHDTGFLDSYEGHEEKSCERMLAMIDKSQFEPFEVTAIGNMIMATKVSRSPATHAEMILRDADLDYLGREDFAAISRKLKEELLAYGIIKDETEWCHRQVGFLEKHRYYTKTSQELRQPAKLRYLQTLKQDLSERRSDYIRKL